MEEKLIVILVVSVLRDPFALRYGNNVSHHQENGPSHDTKKQMNQSYMYFNSAGP